jgi:glycosyltransferase involved in cell wall biosynthesis
MFLCNNTAVNKTLVIGIDGVNIRGGGTVTHLMEILRVADPIKYGVVRVVLWGGRGLLAAIDDRPWLVKRCPTGLDRGFIRRTLWQLFSLSREAKVEKCDLLFVPGGAYAGSFRPVVVMSQNLLPFDLTEIHRYKSPKNLLRLWLLRLIQSYALKRAEGVIFLNTFARETVLNSIGSNLGDVKIIPHGLGARFRMSPRPQHPIQKYTLTNPFRLIYVSTIDEYKHQWHVVEAVATLRLRGYPVTLDLVGAAYPPSLLRLKAALIRLDANCNWVRYHGVVQYEELHHRYAQADLGIFASSCENMPIILLEKMGMGLPIACSNRGAMPEVLGNAGVYFDPESPKDIAHAVRTLIDSPELRSEMASLSFNAAKSFSWENCASNTFAFFAKVAHKLSRAR